MRSPLFALLLLPLAVACANGGYSSSRGGGDVAADAAATDTSAVPSMADAATPTSGCGFIGDACCPTATPCAEGRCVDAMCQTCGSVGESCCPGTPCPGGGVCSAGMCEACGAAGALCCPGGGCDGAGTECVDGRCGTPPSPTDCRPGEGDMRECGHCGYQERSCGATGTWSTWAPCTDEGECAPGDSDGFATCNAECTWEPYRTCSLASCPAGTHIVGFACDPACGTSCPTGYNALECEVNVGAFTACGSCPRGYRAMRGVCDPGCLFECIGGVNAVVCEPF